MICSDAHLGNFGFYASPERNLVFDLNDFDEAHPGPWEWDLRRLATSIWVAGRQNRLPEGTCEDAVLWCAAAYRRQIGWLAGQPLLARSFDRMDIDRMRLEMADWSLRAEIERAANLACHIGLSGAAMNFCMPGLTSVGTGIDFAGTSRGASAASSALAPSGAAASNATVSAGATAAVTERKDGW